METYGLIGKSLKHSFSKDYFTDKFHGLNRDAKFFNFEIPTIDAFPLVLSQNPGIRGLSVTIPYKTEIIPYLDAVDETASAIGSVNSIRVRDGKTEGSNTDATGFAASIKPFLAHGMERALILGTGGASKAVGYALRQIGLDVVFVSRNPEKGQLGYADLNANAMRAFLLIVNTTPLGMFPDIDSFPDLPYDEMSPEHLLYDLTYNPEETVFLRKGREAGALTVNGLSMLKIQAEQSWDFWNSGDS